MHDYAVRDNAINQLLLNTAQFRSGKHFLIAVKENLPCKSVDNTQNE